MGTMEEVAEWAENAEKALRETVETYHEVRRQYEEKGKEFGLPMEKSLPFRRAKHERDFAQGVLQTVERLQRERDEARRQRDKLLYMAAGLARDLNDHIQEGRVECKWCEERVQRARVLLARIRGDGCESPTTDHNPHEAPEDF